MGRKSILVIEGAKGFAPEDSSMMAEGARLHDQVTFGDKKESSLDCSIALLVIASNSF